MGKILNIGDVVANGRLKVVGQLESTGQFSEIYKVMKNNGPGERLLKINLPHHLLDKDAVAECVYDFSKQDHNERTEHEAQMLEIASPSRYVAPLDELVQINKDYTGLLFSPIKNAQTVRSAIDYHKEHFFFEKKTAGDLLLNIAKGTKGIIEGLVSLSPHRHEDLTPCATKPLVHRDIKPDNIIIDGEYHPYFIDFGVACHVRDNRKKPFRGSRTYLPAKTDQLLYPEHLDYWAAGMTLFECLTGSHLFDNSLNPEIKRKNIQTKLQSLHQGREKINEYFDFLRSRLEATEKQWLDIAPLWKCREYKKKEKDYHQALQMTLEYTAYLCMPHNILMRKHNAAGWNLFHFSVPSFLWQQVYFRPHMNQPHSYKRLIDETRKFLDPDPNPSPITDAAQRISLDLLKDQHHKQ